MTSPVSDLGGGSAGPSGPSGPPPVPPPPPPPPTFNPHDLSPGQAAIWFHYSRHHPEIPPNNLLKILERTKWDPPAINYDLAFQTRFPPPVFEEFTEPLELPKPKKTPYWSTADRLVINGETIRPAYLPTQAPGLVKVTQTNGNNVGPSPVSMGPQQQQQQQQQQQMGQPPRWDPSSPATMGPDGRYYAPYPGPPPPSGLDATQFRPVPPGTISGVVPSPFPSSIRPSSTMLPKPKPQRVQQLNTNEAGEQLRAACDNCRRASKKCDRGRPCGRCIRYKYPHCGDYVKGSGDPGTPGHSGDGRGPPLANLAPSLRPTVTRVREAQYTGVHVYEVIVSFPDMPPVNVMRRPGDSWINATHILQAARIDKGPRTRILARDIQVGQHEKIQGGFGKHQGTWIPLPRAIELAREYAVYEILKGLLVANERDLDIETV